MELVIRLSKKNYEHIKALGALWIESERGLPIVSKALLNGIPLPEGHGDLKDENTINLYEEDFYDGADYVRAVEAVIGAQTIIEADKRESEK